MTLWRSFYELYKSFNHDIQSSAVAGSHLFEKCKSWAELFLSLGKSRKGYDTVTPYIHVLVYHIPWFSKQFGSLCKFSGQAVEKCNDLIKTIHHLKTNKHDPAVDALKCRKRIEFLQSENLDRTKRTYEKRKERYWEDDIFKIRSDKKLEF